MTPSCHSHNPVQRCFGTVHMGTRTVTVVQSVNDWFFWFRALQPLAYFTAYGCAAVLMLLLCSQQVVSADFAHPYILICMLMPSTAAQESFNLILQADRPHGGAGRDRLQPALRRVSSV